MFLRILPDYQKNVLKKDIFERLEWLKTCFDVLAHTFRPPEIFFQKRYFERLKWLKTWFDILPDYQKLFFKKLFLNVWSGQKRVLGHFCMLPDHHNHVLNKDIFDRLERLKTWFDVFAHTPRPPQTFFQKRYYWTSGAVKNVFWCLFAYFQTTRIMSLKKIFFNIWSG